MNAVPLFLKLGIGLLLVGFLFKVAVFPFHQWAPDVYQAAASPVSGLMSTAGKVAALSGLIGIVLAIMPTDTLQPSILYLNANIQLIVAIAAAATMLIGNITALSQKNIKRMLAYSSVGHAGYMLMGIISNTNEGISSIVFYSLAYIFTQIGAFIVVSILERKDESYQLLSDYAGLSKRYPFISACMAIFMFSLAGMPPFAGFFGKYFLFKAAIDAGFTWLTIIAVITSLISVYFYLSVIVQMYFKENESSIELEKHNFSNLALVITLIGVIFIGLLPLIDFSKYLF
jgi:NADH-quinone oxidoreductase subunit N